MPEYRALVGPQGTQASRFPDREQAKAAVAAGLNTAADVVPAAAQEIDIILGLLRSADDRFVDYFEADGQVWTAQYWRVSPEETPT